MNAARADGARGSVAAGWIAAVTLAVIYGVIIGGVEFGRPDAEIFSDEATYYLMAHSLASDGDLAYRQEDLLRMLREFRSGPRGVFLKRGKTIDGHADPDSSRLFFGKSFIYPLFAWPFVRLLGTSGFSSSTLRCWRLRSGAPISSSRRGRAQRSAWSSRSRSSLRPLCLCTSCG